VQAQLPREGAIARVRKVIAPMAQDDVPMTNGLDRFAFARIRAGDGRIARRGPFAATDARKTGVPRPLPDRAPR
jgi:hypothetical protein